MAKPVVQFKVDKGVALPPSTRKRTSRYPWDKMQPNDSFFVPGTVKGIYAAAKAHGVAIATRAVTEGGKKGTRIWLVKRLSKAKGQ